MSTKMFGVLLGTVLSFDAVSAGAAGIAETTSQAGEGTAAAASHRTRYWLHPRWGMVLIDAETNRMVSAPGRPKLTTQGQTAQEEQGAARRTRYWLHPRLGMVLIEADTNQMIISGSSGR